MALFTQSHVQGAGSTHQHEDITTVVVDEVHTRSVQSDYTLALTLLAMRGSDRIRLVILSVTGDHDLVNKRIPRRQRLILKVTIAQSVSVSPSLLARGVGVRIQVGTDPLEFHGQSSREDNLLVLSSSKQIASKFNLGTDPSMYVSEAFCHKRAPQAVCFFLARVPTPM